MTVGNDVPWRPFTPSGREHASRVRGRGVGVRARRGARREVCSIRGGQHEQLGVLPPDKRRHFAMLIINIAACYTDSGAAGVVVINRDDQLMLFSAGADEFEAAHLLGKANEAVAHIVCQDAPAKEMFN